MDLLINCFIILSLLHLAAFGYYAELGDMDKAIRSITPVIGVIEFIQEICSQSRNQ